MNLINLKKDFVSWEMNRKERRGLKYSKKRKAAIAMLAAGLLVLSSGGLSTEVIADATDDLAIYGGGGGGGIGGSGYYGGGGGGYVGYGNNYVFGGGADAEHMGTPGRGVGGGGAVGGGATDYGDTEYYGGGNYLYDWGGRSNDGPASGPNGITAVGYKGASPSSLGVIPFGTIDVEKGVNNGGGDSKLTLTSDITVRHVAILAGDCGKNLSYGPELFIYNGGDAVLDASSNKMTVYGKMVIASGMPPTFMDDPISDVSSGRTDVNIDNLYIPKDGKGMEVFDGNNNLDVKINTLTLASGAKFEGMFNQSFEDCSINNIVFENDGTIIFKKNTGTFPSEENLLDMITILNEDLVPSIVFSEEGNIDILTITVGESDIENNNPKVDKDSSKDNDSNNPSPSKIVSPKTGDFENVLLWIIIGSLGIIVIATIRKTKRFE